MRWTSYVGSKKEMESVSTQPTKRKAENPRIYHNEKEEHTGLYKLVCVCVSVCVCVCVWERKTTLVASALIASWSESSILKFKVVANRMARITLNGSSNNVFIGSNGVRITLFLKSSKPFDVLSASPPKYLSLT